MRVSVLLAACLLAPAPARAFDLRKAVKDADLDKAAEAIGKGVEAAREVKDLLEITPEEELAVGREAAANMIAKYGLLDAPALNGYLNRVGGLVAARAGRAGVAYRFGVLDSEFVGAYALPGGFVLLTKGLFARLQNEAQLAGVLAHEVAHVDRQHAMKALQKGEAASKAGKLLGSRTKGGGKKFVEGLSGLLIDLAEKGFSREDEFDADSAGPALAKSAGYDGSGLFWALKRLYGQEAGEHDCGARFRSTHPPLDERLAKLEGSPEHRAKGAVLKKRYQASVSFR